MHQGSDRWDMALGNMVNDSLTGPEVAPQSLLLYFSPVPVANSTRPKRLLIPKLIAWLPAPIFMLAVTVPMEENAGK